MGGIEFHFTDQQQLLHSETSHSASYRDLFIYMCFGLFFLDTTGRPISSCWWLPGATEEAVRGMQNQGL